MAEQCRDIDAALARLEAKINAENKRIAGLESRVGKLERGGSNKQDNKDKVDLIPIYKRLGKLESDLQVIVGFIVNLRPILSILKKLNLFDLF